VVGVQMQREYQQSGSPNGVRNTDIAVLLLDTDLSKAVGGVAPYAAVTKRQVNAGVRCSTATATTWTLTPTASGR
jgi:hypothetical protein